jgi:4-amino-4-deoxy-L-arabinose transferase-like glycosyltransferase
VRLACLVLIAAALRLGGITFGLPYIYSFDEPTSIREPLGLIYGAADALSFANPPLYKYLLVAVFDAIVGSARLSEIDPTLLYLLARATSAVLGTATVAVAYWIGRLLRGNQTGLIAAGLTAVTYLLVRESHFAVNDALATLCSTLALAGCVGVACRGGRREYVAAGVTVGLAFAAKYQAAAVLVPLFVAHVQHGRRRRDVDMLLALGVALVTAVLAFPSLVTDARRVLDDVYVFDVLPARLGYEGLDPAGAYAYYSKAFGLGVGWPVLLLAGLGFGWALLRREWPLLVLASLPLCLYAVLGTSHLFFARFLLPSIPALTILAAITLSDVARRSSLAAVALTALAAMGTLPNSLQFDALLTHTDTRTAAREWVQAHLPAATRVAVDSPPIGPPLDQVPLDLAFPQGHALYDVPLDDYRGLGIEYVITSSYSAEAPNIDADRNAQRLAFYAELRASAQEVAEFVPYHGSAPEFVYDRVYGPFDSLDQFDQPGPTIRIFRLGGALPEAR